MSKSEFIMRWPEFDKQVRCRPIHHNRELFDWFMSNLPTKCVQTVTVVAGLQLYMQNVKMPKVECNWIQENQPLEYMADYPVGRFMFFMTAGYVANFTVKAGYATEPMPYPTWAEVADEDKETFVTVANAIWESLLMDKKTYHVEFFAAED
ncbi:hypothetical protein DWX58_11880 [Pseudoflavonifractor sp. AF19-9AC]|uniref:hypothetical protein n=1 Tax=Pseudoflavonifractor sp. AF19-9AC TaxID=2292244 RepID=UPI000E50AFF2|nr:hypothetical protein [Pseudoflavonifractor sp. AF19-9AC]RHR06658.1 hypothetical protein DWX58_11880 [Pseudoflavonifractor sp. AF19-9AC]